MKQKPSASETEPSWGLAHAQAVEAGEDSYRDPQSGYQVWTELYLRKRGECCGSGCRHCPYRLRKPDVKGEE